MEALLGFQLDFWDYSTFLSLFVLVVAGLGLAVFILGLPGRIAIARNHPEAEAVFLTGWVGFLAVVPWIQAPAWAFRPKHHDRCSLSLPSDDIPKFRRMLPRGQDGVKIRLDQSDQSRFPIGAQGSVAI